MPTATLDDIMDRIRADGGRVTQSRRMVVETILEHGGHHLTAPELVDAMRAMDPEFHESTVYRVLERLTDLHILEPVQVQHGATIFHLTDRTHTHHHLVCTECGAVAETDPDLLDEVARRLGRRYGFVLKVDSPATLLGTCSDCHDDPTA